MSLEDQLSLSRNGGVYYEGTRVKPTEDPILFIGLGGTGADALLRVKNEVQTRMILPKGDDGRVLNTSPNNIAFLAIDTDRDILNKTCGVAGFDPSGDELVQISVDGLPTVIKDIVDKHLSEPQWNWYDKELSANGGLDGANGIRQIGRFMLFWNFQSVKNRFESVISKLLKATKGKSNSLKIFILTGIGGGTGSGTFLDIAYLSRAVALPLTPNVQVQGYIFTPDLNKGNGGDADSMYRNGFAALKELDYWMSSNEHQQHFVQQYAGGFIINSIDKPYDYCHVITSQNAQHQLISYYEALDAVGSNLFSYIVSEENLKANDPPALKTMYDNIAGHISYASATMLYPANYNYLSVGSNMIEIPYTEITTLVAARVFEKLEPVFKMEPTRDSFAFDLNNLQLTYDHLWGYIHTNVSGMPLNGKTFSYNEIWPNNRPYRMVYDWLNGHAQQQLRLNRSNFTSHAEGILRPYLERLIRSAERGPCYASRMILSNTSFCLIKTLKGFADDCRERMAAASSRLPGLKTKMEQEFAGGQRIPAINIIGRSSATRDYMAALTDWIECEYAYWGYYELADALDDYAKRLQVYHERIFKRLLDTLVVLPGIFRENVSQIVVQEEAAQRNETAYAKYLIRPMQFEREYRDELSKKVDIAAGQFLNTLSTNLKLFVGISMDEIDQSVVGATDISGVIANFINSMFSETLTMNIEKLLEKKIPVGKTPDDFYYDTLCDLREGAIPMYHTGVQHDNLNVKAFSLVSIPDDCAAIYQVASERLNSSDDRPKSSSERSKLQWVKVQAGMPLFAFPEVTEMEKKYEVAMKASLATRRGVHLRWEWREQLPSPLPEATWEDANATEKTYAKEYNARVRKAFDLCLAAGIIREAPGGEYAYLYVASADALKNVELHGSVREKRGQLEMLRQTMWSNQSTAMTLNPFGSTEDGRPMIDKARENVLRFYNISSEIINQAGIYEQYLELDSKFTNVEQYINAIFADLIYDQGYERKFRRAKNDFQPIKLFDKMTQTSFPDYETFKTFCDAMTAEIRNDISSQFDAARQGLLSADGGFNAEAANAKMELLHVYEERFSAALETVKKQIEQTPINQRGELIDVLDFYDRAIELINQIKQVILA